MQKAVFFAHLRSGRSDMFGPRFTQSQITGIEGILDAFAAYGDGRIKTLAYALATARREVGAGMVPVREGFKATDAMARAYVMRHYGHKGLKWYCYPAGPDDHVYYGRGLVQMTWVENYAFATFKTGIDFLGEPDLALVPENAGRLLVTGIMSGQWNKYGLGIAHYLPDDGSDDLAGARRTVNGLDHWQEIAGHYREFLAALEAAGFPGKVVPAPELEPDPWGADDAAFADAETLASAAAPERIPANPSITLFALIGALILRAASLWRALTRKDL